MKLLANSSQHSYKRKAKFQCRICFPAWVSKALFFIIILYFDAFLRTLIKTEPTTEKLPNFRQILMILWTYLRQNLNVVAGFTFELLHFDFPKKHIFMFFCRIWYKSNNLLKKCQNLGKSLSGSYQLTSKVSMSYVVKFLIY